jgi:hypothetical protein
MLAHRTMIGSGKAASARRGTYADCLSGGALWTFRLALKA